MWQYYNPNPAGRSVDDCSVRAISAALGIDWEQAYALTAAAGFSLGNIQNGNEVWGAVLRRYGFYRHNLPNTCPDCYTAADFAHDHPRGIYVLGFGNHVATVRDGIIYDAWNSSNEIPQYVWFRKD